MFWRGGGEECDLADLGWWLQWAESRMTSVALLRWQEVNNVLQTGYFWKSGEEKKDKQEREENTDDVNFAKFQCCISMLAFKNYNRLHWNGWQFIQVFQRIF